MKFIGFGENSVGIDAQALKHIYQYKSIMHILSARNIGQ